MNNLDQFRGNPNLKKSGQAIEWTQELVQEYMKCAEDPIYFGENYFFIVTEDGKEKITLRDYQKELILSCLDNRYSVAEMARQSGKTTAITIFVLWYVIFHELKNVAILANKGETAREILGLIQFSYELLPKWLQHGVREWNKGSFVLENGSRILAAATSASAIRGFRINCLYIDEAAHIENWDEFFTSVYPTISAGQRTKVILISTVLGMNHFFDITENARQGKNSYNLVSVPWHRVPGRDERWKEETLAGMNYNYEKFAQEYENEYLGSSGTLIGGWKLKEMVLDKREPLLRKANICQYERPIKGHRYALVADTSRGKGLDFSAFHIIDVTELPYKQVCTYHDNMIAPIDYAEVIHRMAKTYNDAMCLIENNDIGAQVADVIFYDYEYDMVLQTESAGRSGKRVSSGFGSAKAERGIRTTITVKAVGCSMAKMLIEQDKIKLVDEKTIEEFKTFSKKGNSYEAESGKTDDLVMGIVLFGWLTNQDYFKEATDINTLVELREKSEEDIMADLIPFGFVDDHNMPDNIPMNESLLDHYALNGDSFDKNDGF